MCGAEGSTMVDLMDRQIDGQTHTRAHTRT